MFKPCVCILQQLSNTDLQWCYHPATWGTHHRLHLFCLNLVHVSDDETLPNSMALVESVCVLTPQGCLLTFLQPSWVDQGHDLEAFRKKMRVKCHIGHTDWLYGITCLAHLIDVVYDFPVKWSQNPTCKLSSKETHKSSCAWVDCNLSSFIQMCCIHKSNCCIHLSQLAWWNRLKAASVGGNQIPWWFTVDKIWPQIYPERGQQKNAVHSTGQLEAWLDQDFCACKVAAATISCQEDLRGSCPLTSLLEDHVEFRDPKSYPKVNLWILFEGWIIQHSLHQRGHVKIIL